MRLTRRQLRKLILKEMQYHGGDGIDPDMATISDDAEKAFGSLGLPSLKYMHHTDRRKTVTFEGSDQPSNLLLVTIVRSPNGMRHALFYKGEEVFSAFEGQYESYKLLSLFKQWGEDLYTSTKNGQKMGDMARQQMSELLERRGHSEAAESVRNTHRDGFMKATIWALPDADIWSAR